MTQLFLHLATLLVVLFSRSYGEMSPFSDAYTSHLTDQLTELDGLSALYDATNGDNWSWRNSSFGVRWIFDPCADNSENAGSPSVWQGLKCSQSPDACLNQKFTCKIINIQFENYNLRGSIPSEIGVFSSIYRIIFNANNLTGTIPTSARYLTNLTIISLGHNSLMGSLPSEVGMLKKLQYLNVSYNSISGSLPREIGSMTSLRFMYLDNNRLVGSFPTEIGKMQNLESIYVINNFLVGPFLPEITMLSKLQLFAIMYNKLTGTLPSTIGNLQNLRSIFMRYNQLTGTIPTSFWTITNLERIGFLRNSFEGSIPSEIGNQIKLTNILLNNNCFRGTIPSTIAKLGNLSVLSMHYNCFEGTIPSVFGQLRTLERLGLNHNKLTGTLPSELAKLTSMTDFAIQFNSIRGTVPSNLFCDMNQLKFVRIYDNYFSGPISKSLFEKSTTLYVQIQNNNLDGKLPTLSSVNISLSAIDTLDISGNHFTGSLPSTYFMFPKLRNFAAVSNCFSGELPSTICSSSVLRSLQLNGLSSNRHCKRLSFFDSLTAGMSGSIPPCVYQIKSLQSMYISGNRFTGHLGDLVNGSELYELYLSHNYMTGTIPESYLSDVAKLDLSFNRIGGVLKSYTLSSKYRYPENISWTLDVNRLSGEIPSGVEEIGHINLLIGNMFCCDFDNGLPRNDPAYNTVSCGSKDLDRSLYALSIILVSIIAIAIYFVYLNSTGNVTLFFNEIYLGKSFPHYFLVQLERYPELYYVFRLINAMVMMIVSAAGLTIIVCIPMYSALKSHDAYKSHTFQYRWFPSAVMLTGLVPALTIFFCWVALILYVYYLFVTRFYPIEANIRFQTESRESFDERPASPNGGFMSRICFNNFCFYNKRGVYAPGRVRLVAFVCVIFFVSALMNGGYVLAVVWDSSTAVLLSLQISFALIRLALQKIVAAILSTEFFDDISMNTKMLFMMWLSMINDILMPVMASMCVDPACFLALIVEQKDITSTYYAPDCIEYEPDQNGNYGCVSGILEYSAIYSPAFIYNFQCSTSVLERFIPVILFANCFSISNSLMIIVLANSNVDVQKYFPAFLLPALFPPLLFVDHTYKTKYKSCARLSLMKAHDFIAQTMEYLAQIITFGLLSPYVALAAAFSALLCWAKVLVLIFRHISKSIRDSDTQNVVLNSLNADIGDIWKIRTKTLWFIISTTSSILVGLLLIDIAGDDQRVHWIWAIAFLFSCMFVAFILWLVSKFVFTKRNLDASRLSRLSTVGISLQDYLPQWRQNNDLSENISDRKDNKNSDKHISITTKSPIFDDEVVQCQNY